LILGRNACGIRAYLLDWELRHAAALVFLRLGRAFHETDIGRPGSFFG
jgi:hypothetical protein